MAEKIFTDVKEFDLLSLENINSLTSAFNLMLKRELNKEARDYYKNYFTETETTLHTAIKSIDESYLEEFIKAKRIFEKGNKKLALNEYMKNEYEKFDKFLFLGPQHQSHLPL